MIVLQNLTDSLEIKIGSHITSGPINVFCSYQDSTLTRTIPLESSLTIGDVGSNILIYPPILYHTRKAMYISVVNTDSVDADVTLEVSKDGIKNKLIKVTLAPGDKLEYADGYGFKSLNADGEVKNTGSGGGGGGAVDSVNGYTGVVVLDKTDIGLSNVPNVDATVAANITQTPTNRFVSDTDINFWNGYTNPANIIQNGSYRFVTDTEKAFWNGYTNPANITQSASYRFVTDTEKAFWNGYTNPANIVQTSSYRFVTDTEKATYQTGYNNAAFANGGATTAITFATSKYYGTATAPLSSGSVTYNFTNAVAGSKAIIFHNAGSEPTYPAGTYKQFGSYVTGALNILTFTFLDTNTILLDITYSQVAGLQPEVNAWLSKGGVATGFVLTALNDFMLSISSIRSKILRMNVMFGETFNSMFIPLIVNDDGSSTPLGGALDTNVNFVSGNWTFLGTNGGLSWTGASRYIQTPFVPSTISQYGLDDASFGCYYSIAASTSNTPVQICGAGSTLSLTVSPNGQNTIGLNGTTTTSLTTNWANGRFMILSRTSSTAIDWYYNGVKTTTANNSTTKANSAFYFGSSNTAITSGVGAIGGYFIGKGIDSTQESILRSSWAALHGKLGHTV